MSFSLTTTPPGPDTARHARTLQEIFTETVARSGTRIAIDTPEQQLSYQELDEATAELARRLAMLGVGPGDRVGVRLASGTAQLYTAILGVIRSGAAYVPVDADDPPARAEAVWSAAGACAVIEDQLAITDIGHGTGAERRLTVDDDAWIIFTSGSTGRPKGVAVPHSSAAAFVDAETHLWTVHPEDRVLAGLSVGFDASCEEMWLAWRNGAALVPAPRALVRSGSELGPWLSERGVTVVSTVPTLAAMWNSSDLAGVRLLILGGEACPDALGWRLAADREVWNTYGPTEATVVSTAVRVRTGVPITIGWPLRGWDVAIVDAHGERLPFGEAGELAIGGVGLARYIDASLDAKRYAPLPGLGWKRAYRTGDIAYETVDGVQFVGRRDDQVKLGGRRLELGEIDGQMNAVPGVRAACAAVQRTGAGNPVLVGYMVGSADPAEVRNALTRQLPEGILPLVVKLESLPRGSSGKVDRRALPWPPPAAPNGAGVPLRTETLSESEAWLAERWAEQLGPLPVTADSDFFALGGTSMAAAKLVSVLRDRYGTVTVADIYEHRRLRGLAARLANLEVVAPAPAPERPNGQRRWGLVQLVGVFALLVLSTPQWLLGILALDNLTQGSIGPTAGWGWLIGGWLVFGSAIGRASIVVLARRVLLGRVRPGRYPRHGALTCRLWFLERLSEAFRFDSLSGTPFAARYARLCGHRIGAGARLGTLPPVTSSVVIGAGATIEGDVDMHGWWLAGDELIIGDLTVGAGARIGTRTLLSPGAEVGVGAEIEAGSVISGTVPAGERWGGSPAIRLGIAGERWPSSPPPSPRRPQLWRAMFGAGIALQAILPLAALAPGLILLALTGAGQARAGTMLSVLIEAPLIAGCFLLTYASLVALLVRLVGSRIRPGWHADEGGVGWALWLNEALMASACAVLRPLFLSLVTRRWLRLAGLKIGRRAELSTAVGLNRLTSFAPGSFVTDDVVFATARTRGGWLHVAGIEVGGRTFVGNSAILSGASVLGDDGLIGVLTTPPCRTPNGTSWFGSPPLELPRVPDQPDRSRTFDPPGHLVAARAVMELIRTLLPATVSVALAALVIAGLEAIGARVGILAMAVAAPVILGAAGLCAAAITVALKWLLMGRYRVGEHPFWSCFVWRDEIVNCLQEELARPWLLGGAIGTPVMSWYLRAMGAKVGRNVWFETLAVTEFDVVALGDGCVVNRGACVETHLFHDRLMRIGPARLGPGSTLGPSSVVLPDTVLGAGARVGARSVVLRGEELPAGTSWHGSPVACA